MKGAVRKPTGTELRACRGFISVVSHHTTNGLNFSQSQYQHRSPSFLLLTTRFQPVPAAEIPGFLGEPFQQPRSHKPYQSVPHEELLHSNHSTATPVTWLLTITANCEGLGCSPSPPMPQGSTRWQRPLGAQAPLAAAPAVTANPRGLGQRDAILGSWLGPGMLLSLQLHWTLAAAKVRGEVWGGRPPGSPQAGISRTFHPR